MKPLIGGIPRMQRTPAALLLLSLSSLLITCTPGSSTPPTAHSTPTPSPVASASPSLPASSSSPIPASAEMIYQAPPNAQLAYIVQTPGTDLWFSATNLHQLGSIDMSGKVTMHSLGSPGVKPTAIASGATPFDPSIWFVDSASDSIGAFSPAGVKEYQSASGHVGIQQLASGPGEVWFSEQAANAIAKLDGQTGKIVEFPLPKTGQGASAAGSAPRA